jgi:hypothetical protein
MATLTGPTPIIAVSEMTLGGDPRADTPVDLPPTLKIESANHYANQFEEIKSKTKALKSWKRTEKGETLSVSNPRMEAPTVGQKRISYAISDADTEDSPTPKKTKRSLTGDHAHTKTLAGAVVQPRPSQ